MKDDLIVLSGGSGFIKATSALCRFTALNHPRLAIAARMFGTGRFLEACSAGVGTCEE